MLEVVRILRVRNVGKIGDSAPLKIFDGENFL